MIGLTATALQLVFEQLETLETQPDVSSHKWLKNQL